MKKLGLLMAMVLGITSLAYCATGWLLTKPAGTDSPGTIETSIQENNTALDLMLSKYRQGAEIVYASAATLTVNAGQLMVSNSGGTVRLMLSNTSATTVSWTNIDTGSEAASTTYYVYAIASATTDTTFTIKVSTSSTAPSGVTYYRRLGSFYNDASSNISLINNDDDLSEIGEKVSKSVNVSYQALTDGTIKAYLSRTAGRIQLYSDSASTPTSLVDEAEVGTDLGGNIGYPVKKGDYYKVTGTVTAIYWIPKQ